jgi:DNA-binding response OmpR family regulator
MSFIHTKVLKAALLSPHISISELILPATRSSSEVSIVPFQNVDELISQSNLEIDIIILPSLLSERQNALNCCLQLKASANTTSIPISIISTTKDLATISSLYGSGADIVFVPPFDTHLIHQQLLAINRLTQIGFEKTQSSNNFSQALLASLHAIDQAMVIFSLASEYVFSNLAAKNLFGYIEESNEESSLKNANILSKFAKQHSAALSNIPDNSLDNKSFSNTLYRITTEPFPAQINSTILRTKLNEPLAICLVIKDLTPPVDEAATLTQLKRTQTYALLLAARCMNLLGTQTLGAPSDPLSKLNTSHVSEKPFTSLSQTLMGAIEALDLFVSSDTDIKVEINQDYALAICPSDLFQLLGHCILHGTHIIASPMEITVKTALIAHKNSIKLSIHCHSLSINNCLVINNKTKEKTSDINYYNTYTLPTGIELAQEISQKYSSKVDIFNNSTAETVIEVLLPIVI